MAANALPQKMSPVFKNGKYSNPWTTFDGTSATRTSKLLKINAGNMMFPSVKFTAKEIEEKFPVESPDATRLANPDPNDVQVTWIGHATALIQMQGLNILTDPVWAERCSPASSLGPKRLRPIPLPLNSLPKIDIVLITHSNYDHLDAAVVERLKDTVRWIVPRGLKPLFTDMGITNVTELIWWENLKFSADLEIICTPCQSWSKRKAFKQNTSLWCSWSLMGKKKVFFCGSSGYSPTFRTIGEHLGPFNLALIPIGGYAPREDMRYYYLDPPEAVQAHSDLKSEQSIGILWGTFKLSSELIVEPRRYLHDTLIMRNFAENSFITINHGKVWSQKGDGHLGTAEDKL